MKKVVVMFLCAMLTMGSISACGKSESDKNGKNTVQAQTEDKTTEENKTEDKAEDSDTEAKEEADKNSESSEMETRQRKKARMLQAKRVIWQKI